MNSQFNVANGQIVSFLATDKLKAQRQELEVALVEFTDALPESMKTAQLDSQSWESLYNMIRKLQRQHEAKHSKGLLGQTKQRFHRICETIENHSSALKLIPTESEYTSIICGTLGTITKVRHLF